MDRTPSPVKQNGAKPDPWGTPSMVPELALCSSPSIRSLETAKQSLQALSPELARFRVVAGVLAANSTPRPPAPCTECDSCKTELQEMR